MEQNLITFYIDGISARKFTFFDPNTNVGSESWSYMVGSAIYRIDFEWVGEDPGNNQRFFDAVIDSYKITVNKTVANNINKTAIDIADKLLYNGTPVDTIMQ